MMTNDTPRAVRVLGISAFYHDSAAALVVDGVIVAAAHEERFTRKKHDDGFPEQAIRYVLSEYGLSVTDLDAIIFYDKPYIKFERLLETYHAFSPAGVQSFLAAIPVWIKEKLFMRKMLTRELARMGGVSQKSLPRILFSEHHLSHIASAFYPSPFKSAAILTVDGVGEWSTTTIAKGDGADITILKEIHFPHSLGLLYSAFTYYCGFKVNSGEYKLMGLAPYGSTHSRRVDQYVSKITQELISIKEDGSFTLNMGYFDFATGLTMTNSHRWEQLFGFARREPESELTAEYTDLAQAIQKVTEEVMLRLAKIARTLTGEENLVLAGGVALNCVANARVRDALIFKDIWIEPAAGDAGGALGAALAGYHIGLGNVRIPVTPDAIQGSYLGPEYGALDVERVVRKYGFIASRIASIDGVCELGAQALAEGKVLGWFQGRMEWGPRALGNRSILADPRSPEMQKTLNLKIKYREGFRPFAPAVLEEDVADYFETTQSSPYMLFTAPVRKERRKPLLSEDHPLYERLYSPRSDIPSVTHLDYSARLQTVSRGTNEPFWKLIQAFKRLTGFGLVVNTSFNIRNEPIVCSPEDALRCFMNTEMDVLIIGTHLFEKKMQPFFPQGQFKLTPHELD